MSVQDSGTTGESDAIERAAICRLISDARRTERALSEFAEELRGGRRGGYAFARLKPPQCGDTMPDGRSTVVAVRAEEQPVLDVSVTWGAGGTGTVTQERGALLLPGFVEVGFSLAGQVRYRAWPCTNRRAKRQRGKARRRERKPGRPTHCPTCNAVLEYARSGWETTSHNAYRCDADGCERVLCWTCLNRDDGYCVKHRSAESLGTKVG